MSLLISWKSGRFFIKGISKCLPQIELSILSNWVLVVHVIVVAGRDFREMLAMIH